jgi:hypothetical protein
MGMRSEFARVGALTLAVLICLIALEAALLAAAVGHGPNAVIAPMAEQFALLTTLWGSNPAAALPLIAQQPVFVIAHNDPASSVPIWGLYYFPFTLLVHLAIAPVVALQLRRSSGRRRPGLLIAGGVVLVFAVSYTRIASCCTGGPRWALEIWLLALAFDPTRTLIDWSALIVRLEGLFPYIQFAIGMAGIALLIAATWRPPRGR